MNKSSLIPTAIALMAALSFGPAASAQTPAPNTAIGGGFKFTTDDALAGLLVAGLTVDALSTHSWGGGHGSPFSPATPNGSAASPFAPAGATQPMGGVGPARATSAAPVPEASTSAATALMLLLGMGSLLSARRRRRVYQTG